MHHFFRVRVLIILLIFLISVALFTYNFYSNVQTTSAIKEENYSGKTVVKFDDMTPESLFRSIDNKEKICSQIRCQIVTTAESKELIEISFTLLNLLIKFRGDLKIKKIISKPRLEISIDGDLLFSSNSFNSPQKIFVEITVDLEEEENTKKLIFQSSLDSRIVKFASKKLGETVTKTTIDNLQNNLVIRLIKNDI